MWKWLFPYSLLLTRSLSSEALENKAEIGLIAFKSVVSALISSIYNLSVKYPQPPEGGIK
jgi:hypothetical protein